MLGPVGPACNQKLEVYGRGDEEKRACGLKEIAEGADGACIIFSIGSNNQWIFEEDIFDRTQCKVETFDCTVGDHVHPPERIQSRVHLHRICLGENDVVINNRTFMSWQTVNKMIGLKTGPSFLKMDIEGYEFDVMKSIINSGTILPLQIAMEIHFISIDFKKYLSSAELLTFMNFLRTFGGYYLVDRHDNDYCPHCSEILLAKLDCANHPLNETELVILEETQPQLFKYTSHTTHAHRKSPDSN
eukprot:CAMPEP_0170070144 /NCGR_PEP_ID=MMETSP0019_2-20121128/8551_1 /TAXON_ID=98059 /ORGANISM="Dinobryon sp., Strain UTEXLB2267" /LENGTH=244 /DNA_ID=CAMNT_0010278359 /DNA_START=244 /DNA_END=978 /DNA_ORIENTATION=+